MSYLRIGFGLTASSLIAFSVLAGENEATRELIRFVNVDDAQQWNEATKLDASIAPGSAFKPVASQSLALISIRQGNYSEAWKLLNAQSNLLPSTPIPYKLGHEKLMLWLYLQANSAAKAESQFNRLVTIALDKDLPDPERRDLCHFLGGVIGMLQSSGETSCVPATTLEQRKISLEKIDSKPAAEQLRFGMEAATQWHKSLQERLDEFRQADPEKTSSVLLSLKQEFNTLSSDLTKLSAEIKQENIDKSELSEEVNKLQKAQNVLTSAWNTPTPGKPVQPIKPNQPVKPRPHYETTYETDSKTGKRTAIGQHETAASKRASDAYFQDMRLYNDRLAQYTVAIQTYPARLAAWTQTDATRRSNLQDTMKKTAAELHAKKPVFDEMQEKVKEKIVMSKAMANDLRLSKATIAIATIAKQHTESKSSVAGSIAKPSHFELLAWESEVVRLEKCLREIRR